MRRALVLLLAVLALLVAAPASAAPARPDGVVVVAVAGLDWDDLGARTPTLSRLARTAAVGVLSVKALPAVTCPADGWLTLGAGARAQAFGVRHGRCDGALRSPRAAPGRNSRARDVARRVELGAALPGRVRAVGPGAELALGPATAAEPALTLVDAGSVGQRDDSAGVAEADAAVAQVLAGLPPRTDLLVLGLSEAAGEDTARLHVAMATGPSFPRGALTSASTGRAPYVQLVDVAPTVLALLGVPVPATMDGQPWQARGSAPSVPRLVDLALLAVVSKSVTVPFFVVVLVAEALLLLALRTRPRAARLVALAATGVLGASYAANLVPWWRSSVPLLALLVVSVGTAAVVTGLSARTRTAAGWVCAAVAGLLVIDLVTGAHLQMSSVAGYSALVAGRFAGIGNVAFGVYAAAALLGTALLAGGRPLPVVVLAGLVAVAADGAPPWGSDVGGVLALLPAYVVLALVITGTRVSLLRVALAGLAGALVVTAFALADAARPPEQRTHLGRFAHQVADGTAGEVLRRKAEAVFGLLFHSPVTAALPLAVAAAVLLVLRPPAPLAAALAHVPGLRAGLAGLAVACTIGFAVNDSGAAVPALALAVAVPAVCALVAERAAAAGRAGAPDGPAAAPR